MELFNPEMGENEKLEAIHSDQINSLIELEKQYGFKLKTPRIEWDAREKTATVIYSSSAVKKFDFLDLTKIMENRKWLDNKTYDIIRDWFEVSDFKHGYRLKHIAEQVRTGTYENIKDLQRRYKKIKSDVRAITLGLNPEFIKKGIAYLYNVQGEQLSELYELIGREKTYEEIIIGNINMFVNLPAFDPELKDKAYSESRGIIEDAGNAYTIIKGIKGECKCAHSIPILYTNENVHAEGKGFIEFQKSAFEIEIKIRKEGDKLRTYSQVEIRQVPESPQPALLETILAGYDALSDRTFIRDDGKVGISWDKNSMSIYGNEDEPLKDFPRILDFLYSIQK